MSFEYLEAGVSVARNRAIMGILHAIGYVEKHGTVYAKALAAAEQDYPLPVWEEPGPVVRVVLRPHPRALNVEEPPKRQRRDRTTEIVEYLEGHGETTVAELSEAIGISTRQVRNYIQRLEKASRVEPTAHGPRDPRRAYRLAR
jgi:predicted HTH transcriptional regulator